MLRAPGGVQDPVRTRSGAKTSCSTSLAVTLTVWWRSLGPPPSQLGAELVRPGLRRHGHSLWGGSETAPVVHHAACTASEP
eukprot:7384071-Prorocentrum_lima.AAC.1